MAVVGITSRPAPATVAAIVSSSSSPHCHVHLLHDCFAAAASFLVRCAAAAAEDVLVAAEGDPNVAGGAATSTRPPYSLISEANVQKAMRSLAITDADHYGRLGITRLACNDEVKAAYEKKCEELNSKGLEEEEIIKDHDLLKEYFTILSTEEERRLYDWSLARSGQRTRR